MAIVDSLRVERVTDSDLIAETVAHPRIYPHISDDSSPPIGEFRIDATEYICLGAFKNDAYMGFFMCHRHNGVTWEIHTCLLPSAWGNSREFGKAAINWVFDNLECERLITSVPEDNHLALKLAMDCGMGIFGVNPKSIKRGGRLMGQVMLGTSKG